jgi:O-antigen/teichoic acid export membrane protein
VSRFVKLVFSAPSLVYAGNMARAVLGFAINLLIARWLGPEQFGIYYLFIVIVIIAHNAIGEGLDPGVVRLYASDAARGSSDRFAVVGSSLFLRLSIGVPVVAIGLAGGGWISENVFDTPDYSESIRLAFLAALGSSLFGFGLAILQARQKFVARSLMTPIVNAFRIAAVPILFAGGWFVLPALLWLHTLLFFVAAFIVFCIIRDDLLSAKVSSRHLSELFHFSKWSSLAFLALLTYSNLGVPYLSRAIGAEAAGIFAAAASLTLVIEQAVAAINAVQLPSISKMNSIAEYRRFFYQSLLRCGLAAIVLSPVILLANPIILIVYGPLYSASGTVFMILFASILINLATHPVSQIFFAINRPRHFALCHGLPIFVWLLVAFLLVPSHGVIGAAVATLAARSFAAILILVFLRHILWTRADQSRNAPTTPA